MLIIALPRAPRLRGNLEVLLTSIPSKPPGSAEMFCGLGDCGVGAIGGVVVLYGGNGRSKGFFSSCFLDFFFFFGNVFAFCLMTSWIISCRILLCFSACGFIRSGEADGRLEAVLPVLVERMLVVVCDLVSSILRGLPLR